MTKGELTKMMAEKANTTQTQAAQTLEALIEIVSDTLKRGESVKITGFGTFERRVRAARRGVNPQTGESIQIAETVAPAFRAGSVFKAAVNG